MSQDKQKSTLSTGGNAAGHIEIDSRGRNVWQWNDSQIDSTTIMLAQLDNEALELEHTQQVRAVEGKDPRDANGADERRRSAQSVRRDAHDDIELALDVPTIETTMPVQIAGFDPYNKG